MTCLYMSKIVRIKILKIVKKKLIKIASYVSYIKGLEVKRLNDGWSLWKKKLGMRRFINWQKGYGIPGIHLLDQELSPDWF